LTFPLVGTFTAERARELRSEALADIHRHRARQMVLDLSAMGTVELEGWVELRSLVKGAHFLGCGVFLVGIRPEAVADAVAADAFSEVVCACGTHADALSRFHRSEAECFKTPAPISASDWGRA
jgi:anti-anti-sigma regulatory factor